MQVSAVNTRDASYDMTGKYNQGDAYGNAQPTTEPLSFMQETIASIQNLEVQVDHLSKRIPERPPNTLPSNTEVNPREECKALIMTKEAEPKVVHAAEELKEEKA
ncbi:hypothetical protein AHAS_Ahas16G0162500 [Arachis hypogaea]